MAIPVIHALSAAERVCALQEDPVLLLQAALQAVEAVLVQLCAFGSGSEHRHRGAKQPLQLRQLSLLGLMLSLSAALAAPSQAHPDHQQVPSGTPTAPDHEHPIRVSNRTERLIRSRCHRIDAVCGGRSMSGSDS